MKYTFTAKGHRNILATHKNTLEFTKDDQLSLDGDCIVGLSADFSKDKLMRLARGNRLLRMRITAGGVSEEIEFETNKEFSSDRELVLRFSEFSSDRTFGFRATKSAKQLDRKLVEKLAVPGQNITVDIETPYKAVIFDFDETLDNLKLGLDHAHNTLAKEFFDRFGVYEATTVRMLRDIDMEYSKSAYNSDPMKFDRHRWFNEYFRRVGVRADAVLIQEAVDKYWKYVFEASKPMPGAASVLSAVKKEYKTAVMTDSDGDRKIKMERASRSGLMQFIDAFLTSDDIGANKPNRKFYELVLRKLGVDAASCVMVGDKPEVDLQLAKELGMMTVWIKYGDWTDRLGGRHFDYVDHEIKELKELLALLGIEAGGK